MIAGATAGVLVASGCFEAGSTGGGSDSGGDNNTITALMVGNPQMEDIQQLTAENFTKQTGITVRFTILPENELRDKVTQDVANQGGQCDVATVGAYEVPIWSKNGWLHELSTQAAVDRAYDAADLLKQMVQSLTGEDGKMYAAPFYGESSFLMYNKDLFARADLTMPDKPTWAQVAEFAAKLDDKANGVAGICLRGLPGWGELFAPLTTVVNTYGGTWFEKDWTPKVNLPEFKEATRFYVDLVRKYGQSGAPQSGFTECLNTFGQGNAAMWYDATSAAGTLEDPNASKVAGRVGYAYAPVHKTEYSAGCGPGRSPCRRPPRRRTRLEVHFLGDQQGLREAGGPEAGLVPVAVRQAHVDVQHPAVPGIREGVRRGDARLHPARQPAEPRRAAAARAGRAVRRHPGVRRSGHQGVPGGECGAHRQQNGRQGAE
jgi:sorbitol/mannitol transport system substrate-binding protein